jgi:CRISPR-associated protein Cas2
MSGFYAVCFDVCDPGRLRRVSNEMENFGTRVQRSLFECHLEDRELEELKNRIAEWIDEIEDQVRYYPLCPKDIPDILIDGTGKKTVNSDYYTV